MKDKFSVKDIAQIFCVSKSSVRMWVDNGFTCSSVEQIKRRGCRKLFSRRDIYQISAFRIMVEYGFSQELAAECSLGRSIHKKSLSVKVNMPVIEEFTNELIEFYDT